MVGTSPVTVTGNGSAVAPFTVGVNRAALITAGAGITYDPGTGTVSVHVSADPGNAAGFGSDNGFYVYSGSGGPLAVCSTYFQTDGEGKLCLIPGSMSLRQILTFATPGTATFTKATYPWLSRIKVRAQAGGGGSAGAAAAASESIWRAGGAGGSYGERLIDVGSLAASETITVGAGGTAGAAANGAAGNGANSSFGALLTTLGGPAGATTMATGATATTASGTVGPGPGTGGYLNLGGGSSGGSIRLTGSAGIGGSGGDAPLGQGGAARATAGVGNQPRGYGAGGGGSVSANGASQAGRAGGDGIVIVELYG
ncbi:hypothetical protein ACIQZO_06050 [Streptomyces sp. NPDC097617]|uniref:glycine-rich domain-containing protein n=1 Tax=Streptomyces sp. NPDC097617 TaxID=3366091 RepID=UPI0038035A5B